MTACALTGHRRLPPDFDFNALYDALEHFAEMGCGTFYCGMAQGFDLAALDCLVDLKMKYPIRIVACIPFAGQERSFPAAERKKYRELLQWCDEKVVLSPAYHAGSYLMRNRYMVERADVLLAYCKKETGGSAYTLRYAREMGLDIYKIE